MRFKGKFVSLKKLKKIESLKSFGNSSSPNNEEENTSKQDTNIQGSWTEGRRIVELGLLARGLMECINCKKHLYLENCVDEKVYGLGSILYISCTECKSLNSVPTGKRHSTSENGDGPARCFDINSKLAAAMLNVGIGEQQINNILAELNLPTIHHKTLKQREREVGRAFEKVAESSCDAAIESEMSFSGDSKVSCDGGWQRRGTGLNYDSLSEQNKGDENGMRTNLEAIVPHAFGNHTNCNDSWCGYKRNPSAFRYKSLPFGKALEGEELQNSLKEVFQKQVLNVKKLLDLDSSNANENLNQMIAKKAPKAQHYSGSESLSYRVSAAIAQKNEGHQYLLQVNTECNLSPGKKTEERLKKLDKKSCRKKERQTKRETKRNRLTAKQNRHTSQKLYEISEGTTYERDVGFSGNINDDDLKEIPVFRPRTNDTNTKIEHKEIIIIDLETTGFSHGNDMIQIAAKTFDGKDTFSRFVQPENGYIPPVVSKLTGIEIHGYQMYHHFNPVRSYSKKSALSEFTAWLQKYPDPLLVAHNAPFDSRVLVNAFIKSGMESDLEKIGGFADSIKTFKEVYPEKTSYKLGNLARELAPTFTFDAHSADGDVNILHHLLGEVPNVRQLLKKCVVSVECVMKNIKKTNNKHKYAGSYAELVEKKVLSKSQSETLASSGLSSEHIRLAYHRGGREGLLTVLRGKISKVDLAATRIESFYN